MGGNTDARHGPAGAQWLGQWFGPAKDPSVTPPEFGHFEAVLTALLEPGPLSS
ncbi:MAG TPA: hypothetical protein VE888_15860 [Streptosporangiaceae bacterium]|nr:hypothetical protein [Streptosporangiaceae bacterium]